jgi:hypothetical protein
MQVAYFVRYFDANGGLLKFDMIQCADDTEAMQRAMGKPPPHDCMSVEVAQENRFVWSGTPAELGQRLH